MLEVQFDMLAIRDAQKRIQREAARIDTGTSEPEIYSHSYLTMAMDGLSTRLYGAGVHYNALHAWLPRRIMRWDYELSNTLFNMASALDCVVFALNAIGNSKGAPHFRSIADGASLYAAGPNDIIGDKPISGYRKYFPSLESHWRASADLIRAIVAYYEVTKHRHAGYGNVVARLDAPVGFFDDVPDNNRHHYTPASQIILGLEMKKLPGKRTTDWRTSPYSTLERLMADFKLLIEESLQRMIADARCL